ncbi:MAG: CBS domain-containing protein [Geminicoccaceae bacterium]
MAKTPVREIIQRDTLVRTAPTATVKAAADEMAKNRCGSIVVMEGEAVVGILTERDLLLRVIHSGLDPAATTVAEVMTKSPDTIDADAPVADAIRAMDEFSYRYLPVMDQGRCIGVISTRHLPFGAVVGMEWEIEERHRLAERIW